MIFLVVTCTAICTMVFWTVPGVSTAQAKVQKPQLRSFEKEISKNARLDYLVYLPTAYDESEKSWPLLFWLHGDGGQPDKGGIAEIRSYGPPKMVEAGRDFPFILVAPQLWGEVHWDPDILYATLQEIKRVYRVEEDRVYLMGYSRGGFGSWEFGCSYPDEFAAVVPVSARGMTAVERLGNSAVWIFHGEEDVLPVEDARNMYDELKAIGANVRCTIYPDVGHDACTPAMATEALWEWLLSQRRQKH
jgi:predicted peptidase